MSRIGGSQEWEKYTPKSSFNPPTTGGVVVTLGRGKRLQRFERTIYSVPLGRRKRILFLRDRREFGLMKVLTHKKYNQFIANKR